MPKRTQVVIRASAQDSELFSIQENRVGDLVVFFKKAEELGDGVAHSYSGAIEHRFSVHSTPDRPWNTIKFHIRLNDDTYEKQYVRVLSRNPGLLLWLCVGHSTADISLPRYSMKYRPGGDVISLGEYNPKMFVLTYFIVVSNAGRRLRPPLEMNGRRIDFSNFSVHVFWCYMLGVSFHQSETVTYTHFLEVWRGGKIIREKRIAEGSISFSRGDLSDRCREILVQLAQAHKRKVRNLFEREGLEPPIDDTGMIGQYVKDAWPPRPHDK